MVTVMLIGTFPSVHLLPMFHVLNNFSLNILSLPKIMLHYQLLAYMTAM